MTDEMPKVGFFCWNELGTNDTAKAGKFYGDLLGWEAQDSGMPGMEYSMIKKDGKEVGGMYKITPEMGPMPPVWMAYVTVEDVDASAAKATELGGQVLVPPTDIPTVGRFTMVADPTGAVLGLITFVKK